MRWCFDKWWRGGWGREVAPPAKGGGAHSTALLSVTQAGTPRRMIDRPTEESKVSNKTTTDQHNVTNKTTVKALTNTMTNFVFPTARKSRGQVSGERG